MGRLEVACRRFAVLSGIRQEPGNYTTCLLPAGAAGQRRGMLALVTEPAGDHPALAAEACRIVQEVVAREYYTGEFFSLTSGLLRALDIANSALLNYNYGDDSSNGGSQAVAVQAGGTRTRRSQVGLTAVLLRPDGAGAYIAQLAPTQAYIVHNGMLTALPEPASWAPRGGKVSVHLKRVPAPGEQCEDDTEDDEGFDNEPLQARNLPALPLGSAPGVDVDLIYRRLEPGDVVIAVSSSLARHIDREFAEDVFSVGDPDFIADALFELATEHGLAQSHACTLKIGAEATSGVDTDLFVPVIPNGNGAAGEQVSATTDEVTHAAQQPSLPGLANVLRGPKEWFSRRRTGPLVPAEMEYASESQAELFEGEQVAQPPPDYEATEQPVYLAQEGTAAPEQPEQMVDDPEPVIDENGEYAEASSLLPTEVLLQHSLDVPSYRAQEAGQPVAPAAQEQGELEFNGWEDNPPVFLGRSGKFTANRDRSEWTHGTAALEQNGQREPGQEENDPAAFSASRSRLYPVPTLFQDEPGESESLLQFPGPFRGTVMTRDHASAASDAPAPAVSSPAWTPRLTPLKSHEWRDKGQKALTWAQGVARSMLPDRISGGQGKAVGRGNLMVPARLAIAVGLVLVIAVLGLSLFRSAGSAKQNEAARFLQEAKQEETLGNQPELAQLDKLQHFETAAQKAQAALTADPNSNEAQLFMTTVQGEIDALQGITRVDSKLLFDLDAVDAAGANQTPGGATASAPGTDGASASAAVSATGSLSEIVLQSNDAYVLDKEQGKVYRCGLVSHDCAIVLKAGDEAGGQKVGTLVAMTLRVGNLAVLDSNLSAFIYSADTSGWQAQGLGGTDGLAKPTDFASYDGNLYLLGSRPGQIEKYPSGHYGDPPTDWVQDPAAVDQLKEAASFAIDGSIYVLLPDGKIQVMEGGKITRTITPKEGLKPSTPTSLVTGTDLQGVYLLRGQEGLITRINKEGLTVASLKPSDMAAQAVSGMTVDEGRGKMYLLQGRKVYEAGLTARKTNAAPDPNALRPTDTEGGQSQPSARPTAAP